MKTKLRIAKSFSLLAVLLASLACSLIAGTSATITPQPPTREATQQSLDTIVPTIQDTLVPTTAPSLTPTLVPTVEAQIAPDSIVRRLNAGVFAGKANPLPELKSNDPLGLEAGGLVTTDKNGEAEITIQGCLKLFVFQDTSLKKATCRKEDAASGLGVCGSAGMTGVVNNCTSQVNIQTPSSNVQTHGTWFSVIYLKPDKLSIVQVYEGSVEVKAVIDQQTGQATDGQKLDAGNLWFTQPGTDAPTINGVSGRQAQPMEVWEALRPELIGKYPDLDVWMKTAKARAQAEQLTFPEVLVPTTGQVNLHILGTSWTNRNAQNAFLQGIDWKQISGNLWPGVPVTFQVQFPDRTIKDASGQTYNLDRAQQLLSKSPFNPAYPAPQSITVAFNTNDDAAPNFIDQFIPYLKNIGFNFQIVSWNDEEMKKNLSVYKSGNAGPLIWLDESGKLFQK